MILELSSDDLQSKIVSAKMKHLICVMMGLCYCFCHGMVVFIGNLNMHIWSMFRWFCSRVSDTVTVGELFCVLLVEVLFDVHIITRLRWFYSSDFYRLCWFFIGNMNMHNWFRLDGSVPMLVTQFVEFYVDL